MKETIDWKNLGFGYIKTSKRYVSDFKDGSWDAGRLTEDDQIIMSECAGVLQYAQTCFEGLKAYRTDSGKVVLFRPDLNGERFEESCRRLEIPVFPKERFVDAVIQTVRANLDFVPPSDSGASLYLRPYAFGISPVIGVKPAEEYQFRVFSTPVGAYFKGEVKGIKLKVSELDRAAPHGTGNVKAGLNYAMSLHPLVKAHREGFAENMYLDAATRTKVEETGGANFIFVTKDGVIVTPKSDTILPSITRRSIMYVAEKMLNFQIQEREVDIREVEEFAECGLCGTAAIISPVASVKNKNKEYEFQYGKDGFGPILSQLYYTLTGIQFGKLEAPEGWIFEI